MLTVQSCPFVFVKLLIAYSAHLSSAAQIGIRCTSPCRYPAYISVFRFRFCLCRSRGKHWVQDSSALFAALLRLASEEDFHQPPMLPSCIHVRWKEHRRLAADCRDDSERRVPILATSNLALGLLGLLPELCSSRSRGQLVEVDC